VNAWRRTVRIGSAFLVASLLVTAALGAITQPAHAATLDSFEADLVTQIDAFRAGRAPPTLTVSDTLAASAKWMWTDMAIDDRFAHTSLDGRPPTQRMADAGYPAYQTWTGEDLAAGYSSARDVLSGWIASPPHHAVLVNANHRAIGVGRAYGPRLGVRLVPGGQLRRHRRCGGRRVLDIRHWLPRRVERAEPEPRRLAGPADPARRRSEEHRLPRLARRQPRPAGEPRHERSARRHAPGPRARMDGGQPPRDHDDELRRSGQVGWFASKVRAPSTPGVYRLYVRGAIGGTTWLQDPGIHFAVTVR